MPRSSWSRRTEVCGRCSELSGRKFFTSSVSAAAHAGFSQFKSSCAAAGFRAVYFTSVPEQIVNARHSDEHKHTLPHVFRMHTLQHKMPEPNRAVEREQQQHGVGKRDFFEVAELAVEPNPQRTTQCDHHLEERHDLAATPRMRVGVRRAGHPAQVERATEGSAEQTKRHGGSGANRLARHAEKKFARGEHEHDSAEHFDQQMFVRLFEKEHANWDADAHADEKREAQPPVVFTVVPEKSRYRREKGKHGRDGRGLLDPDHQRHERHGNQPETEAREALHKSGAHEGEGEERPVHLRLRSSRREEAQTKTPGPPRWFLNKSAVTTV